LKCINVSKIYNKGTRNESCALKNISLKFSDSGLVFITGKSGSGKSTLLNVLAGLDEITSGSIFDGNVNLSLLNQKKKNIYRRNNIGFIFQNYNLIDELSVAENVTLGLKKTANRMKELDQKLGLLDIKKYINKKASELSGGEKQRVAIARALYKDSKIIIGDEPTGNLDVANSTIIFDALSKIAKDRLVIVVTHDQESAHKYGDRVIQLQDGEVIADTVEEQMEKMINCDIISKPECNTDLKTSLNLSWKLMKKRKLRMIISAISSAIALSIFGLFVMFSQYDFSSVASHILADNDINTMTVSKGYTDKTSGNFVLHKRVISQNDIQDLILKNNLSNYDFTYLVMGLKLSNSSTGNKFIPQQVYSAVVSSDEGISKYGFSFQAGKYPEAVNEVCITDYLAYCIYILHPDIIANRLGIDSLNDISNDDVLIKGLEHLDINTLKDLFGEDWQENIKNPEILDNIRNNPGILLLNDDVDFSGSVLHITGMLKTDFETKYKDMLYMNETDLKNDDRTDEFTYLAQNNYSYFYVNNLFVTNLYKDKIVLDSQMYGKYSAYKDYMGKDYKIAGNKVIMSSNLFRDLFKQEFNTEKIGTYTFPNKTQMVLGKGMASDVVFDGGELSVVGVFDLPSDYQRTFKSNSIILTSDDYFNDFAQAQCNVTSITFNIPKQLGAEKNLFKYMNEKDLFYSSMYSDSLYSITDIMKVFKNFFVIILVIIIIFAIILMSSFFSAIIIDQKYKIGIMRAMGLNRRLILKTFLSSSVIMVLFVILFSSTMMIALQQIGNKIIVHNFFDYFDGKVMNGLNIISLTYVPFLLITLVSILISIISLIYPIKKLSKMNPIDVIRG